MLDPVRGQVIRKKVASELLLNVVQHLLDGKITTSPFAAQPRLELGQEFLRKRSLHSKLIPRTIYNLVGLKFLPDGSAQILSQSSATAPRKANILNQTSTRVQLLEALRLLESEGMNLDIVEPIIRSRAQAKKRSASRQRTAKSTELNNSAEV